MKTIRKFSLVAITVAAIAAAPLASAKENKGKARFKPGDKTIATIASEAGTFKTLVEALTCTGLVGVVASPDVELTVFAPTDDAFAGLGLDDGNICAAFDTETLSTILLYHVVADRRPSPSVIRGFNKEIEMFAAGSIYPEGGGSLTLFDNLDRETTIEAADVLASNGIIHIVNNVLLPVAP